MITVLTSSGRLPCRRQNPRRITMLLGSRRYCEAVGRRCTLWGSKMTLRGRLQRNGPGAIRKDCQDRASGDNPGGIEQAASQPHSVFAGLRHVLTRNHSEVDDLVQVTLVKRSATSISSPPGTNLRAWLFTIERNTFYTAHQQRRRQAAAAARRHPGIGHIAHPGVVEAGCPPFRMPSGSFRLEQREALLLVAGAGMTYDEAAGWCRIHARRSKSRINRARHRLEELLEAEGAAFLEGANRSC